MLAAAILTLPAVGHAQEAVLSGTVTDSTGGVLPGVTVTAVHEATGNTFVAVTDDRGDFRLPVRVGAYQITLELQGFATLTRAGISLLEQGEFAAAETTLADGDEVALLPPVAGG